MSIAIIAITDGGAQLARQLKGGFPEANIYLPERFRCDDHANYFAEPVAQLLPRLFGEYDALVCIMATGIVMRVLAPQLHGKDRDPAVVVCDEKGAFAISLLSGHLGGANELAGKIAAVNGGQAVITTATDVNQLPAWDEVARSAGLHLEPVGNIRHLNSALLRGEKIVLVDPRRRIAAHYRELDNIVICDTFMAAAELDVVGRVYVTHRDLPQLDRPDVLALRPRDLIVGIGCNRDTSADEIAAVVREELHNAHLSLHSVARIASIDAKADEAGLLEFARCQRLQLDFYTAEKLNRVNVPTAASDYVLQAVGANGVCEPAALLSAGDGGRLIVHKRKNGNVTVAVAEMA